MSLHDLLKFILGAAAVINNRGFCFLEKLRLVFPKLSFGFIVI